LSGPPNAIKRVIAGTDIPSDFHPHSLRHTYASMLIKSGVDIKTVQEVLGHSSASITLDIYGHAFKVTKAGAMKRLGDMIDAVAGQSVQAFLPAPLRGEVQASPEGQE